jgi:hypothetical protein
MYRSVLCTDKMNLLPNRRRACRGSIKRPRIHRSHKVVLCAGGEFAQNILLLLNLLRVATTLALAVRVIDNADGGDLATSTKRNVVAGGARNAFASSNGAHRSGNRWFLRLKHGRTNSPEHGAALADLEVPWRKRCAPSHIGQESFAHVIRNLNLREGLHGTQNGRVCNQGRVEAEAKLGNAHGKLGKVPSCLKDLAGRIFWISVFIVEFWRRLGKKIEIAGQVVHIGGRIDVPVETGHDAALHLFQSINLKEATAELDEGINPEFSAITILDISPRFPVELESKVE